ncbi:(deoxy)nucleoside triphosphate pyrophosphohydrolase [Lapillicoccus sp.]|uniref:(deoxy)nucleoside triphosphate pyrophosphohydrolase n=1 Tax=Lapillicoccus sp. TaxID=1909287 RepID=UPI0032670CEF
MPFEPEPRPVRVVAAAIVDDLAHPIRLLAARRTEPPTLAGGWEFPGGKVDPGETRVDALHREIHEELGVTVVLGDPIPAESDDGSWPLGDRYRMDIWFAVVTEGTPRPLEDHDELRWLQAGDLYAVGWLAADLPIVRLLERRMVGDRPKP